MPAVLSLPPGGSTHAKPGIAKPGVFRRFLVSLMAARQRQADREIAEILARRGGVMGISEGRPPRRFRPYRGGLPG